MIPNKLSRGDTVGIVAPSMPVEPNMEERLTEGIAELEALGFSVILGSHIRSKSLGYTGASMEKAADLNAFFRDPTVNGIICAQGGETSNTVLSFLDWEAIQANPKVFLGLSDITVLLTAIHQRTGMITFHGNDLLWGFGNKMTDYEKEAFERFLMRGESGLISAHGSRKTVRSGTAEGKLLGGNLGCLLKLAGTPFWPDFTDALLFLEDYEITPKACLSAFHQIQQMGVLDQITGVIIGYVYSMQKDGGSGPFMEDVLLEAAGSYKFPILKINDFGHNCPNTILPVGAMARMDADQMTVEILSPCVK